MDGKSHYLIGNTPSGWHTDIPHFGKVRYKQIYDGIDLVYYSTKQNQLEYDFIVAPGADPTLIRLQINGAKDLKKDQDGNVIFITSGEEVILKAPFAYQDLQGRRQEVESRFLLDSTENQIVIALADYDSARPLVIDPILVYSTYFGGSNGGDVGNRIALDNSGNIYLSGTTNATDLPTFNPHQGSSGGGKDVFVSKLNPQGSALIFSTYIGGSGDDENATMAGLTIDNAGNAYITGPTKSTDFPLQNPIQSTYGGGNFDSFIAKLNSSGSALEYSTYIGGSDFDMTGGIVIDNADNAYVVGFTRSTDFPTLNPFQNSNGGGFDFFLTKVNSTGSNWEYSTYLGGSGDDFGGGIDVDRQGNIYVTGGSASSNFPLQNVYQTSLGGANSAIVSKFNSNGSALVYSTYFEANIGPNQIKVDAGGSAHIIGNNDINWGPPNLPLMNPVRALYGGGNFDIFLTKFNSAGSALEFSTFLGGSARDDGHKLALDGLGNIYITGRTQSTDFPMQDPIQATYGGENQDSYVAKINVGASSLDFSTYLGGSQSEVAYDIIMDGAGGIYVTGGTQSTNFPVQSPFQGFNGGGSGDIHFGNLVGDAFITSISLVPPRSMFLFPTLRQRTIKRLLFQSASKIPAIEKL